MDKIIAFLLVVVSFNGLSWLLFVQAPIPLTDVDVGAAVDISYLFLGQFYVDVAEVVFGRSLADVEQHGLDGLALAILLDAQGHSRHEVAQDVGVVAYIVLLNLPEALVEGKLLASLSLHLLEDNVHALGGKDALAN